MSLYISYAKFNNELGLAGVTNKQSLMAWTSLARLTGYYSKTTLVRDTSIPLDEILKIEVEPRNVSVSTWHKIVKWRERVKTGNE